MRWFFGLNCPLGSRGKGPRSIFYLAQIIFITRLLLMRLFSFRAFRENFNDDEKGSHMPRFSYENCKRIFPCSPMTPIFILRLLLWRSFSLRAFSNSVYFHFPYSPIAPIKKRRRRKKWCLIKIPVIDKDLYFKKLKQNHI